MTPTEVRSNRWAQLVAWMVAGLILAGFFTPIGLWTGPILGVWFVLTQKPLRGFAWVFLFAVVPMVAGSMRELLASGVHAAPRLFGLILLSSLLVVVPLVFHRLVSPPFCGLLSTLPFPFAAVAIHGLMPPTLPGGSASASLLRTFLACWLASALVWMWNQEFRFSRFRGSAAAFPTLYLPLAGLAVYRGLTHFKLFATNLEAQAAWAALAGSVALAAVAAMRRPKIVSWVGRRKALAQLQSPFTGAALDAVRASGREFLVSAGGERFSVRDGIPTFIQARDLAGDNGKYNHLYETIGGFYDDTQRFFAAFRGLDIDSYFLNYMSLLDVKAGDSVLETSVGTGLNFKYLPQGVQLAGLDLSAEMLTRCRQNLSLWGLQADLFLGNAEHLPFADSAFDVVYTAGALNFFSDRAQAIREMIRVAKPGAQLLIEDETEEYVKSTYEKIPYTSTFYGKREHPVTVPVDLVPAEMEDIRVSMLKDGQFYAITFRKPTADHRSEEPLHGDLAVAVLQ